jgi:hypothetical protein
VHGRHHGFLEADAPADDLDDRVMQFVVQLAQETMTGAPAGTFAPCTTVSTSVPCEGAERSTSVAPGANVLLDVLSFLERAGALEHNVDGVRARHCVWRCNQKCRSLAAGHLLHWSVDGWRAVRDTAYRAQRG